MPAQRFVGRQKELNWLTQRLEGEAPQLLILHGRRRIGKTRLVKEGFARLASGKAFYYLATLKDATLQRREFQQLFGNFVGDTLLTRHPFNDWEALLSYLVQHHGDRVIAFDELPYLLSADPAFASILQKVWDEQGKEQGAKWVLLGSQVSVMEGVLDAGSPLYGRRTGAWHLQPLSFADLCEYSGLRGMDALRYFGFAGGIPFYWETLGFEHFQEDIRQAVLSPGSLLYDEGSFLVREELREPREYFSLLHLLARGPRALGDLCGELGIGKNIGAKYLSVLQGLHMVERRVPITKTGQKTPGLYVTADPFLRFWFRFVFPYKTSLEMGASDPVIERIERELSDHLAAIYEEVALDMLVQRAIAEGHALLGKGRWWLHRKGKQHEIDGVLRTDEETWVLEAKIGNRVNPKRLAAAITAMQTDAEARGLALGRIRRFAFEAQRCFEGEELDAGR
jgi:AAA+ ATPase superfamily predicted ATPase